jgi:tetratricopeptide (TPR) repeat protein
MRQLKSSILVLVWPLTLPAAAPPQTGAEALYTQLDALLAQHQDTRAEETVQQILTSSNDAAVAYLRIGKIYFDNKYWERSTGFLQRSLKFRVLNDEAHQLLGLDWRALHRPEDAEAELLEAAKENPSNKANAYFAGQQLIFNGKFEAALPYLYSALNAKPLESQALQALGLAQARLGNYGLAESYYRKAIESTQTSRDELYPALLNLSTLLSLGHDSARLAEALTCARRAEALQPARSEPHFLVGKALFKLRRPAEANPELERAAELSPDDSKPHFLLAQTYEQLGQHDRARTEREAVARIQQHPGQGGMASRDSVPVVPEPPLQ